MASDTENKRQGDVSAWIRVIYGLWCCVLFLLTLFVSLLFVAGPSFANEDCRHVYSFRDVVGVVLIGGSFLLATLAGFRAGSFSGRRMIRSSTLRRVWVWVLGLGAALVGGVVATGGLLGLWAGLSWLILGSGGFMSPVCEVVPGRT